MWGTPTAEQIAYMQAHHDDSLVPDIITCCLICGIASIIFILLRLWSRKLVHRRIKLQMSDWLLLIAWIFFVAFDICLAMTTKYGAGRHIIYVTDARMLQILNIAQENTYCFTIAFIKISLLTMYDEIFASRRFRVWLWIVGTFMLCWAIAFSLAGIFQCTPVEYSWDKTIAGGHCIDYVTLALAAGYLTIATDFMILLMPIPLVWRLHTSMQKKWQIILTFCMGSSACIVSTVKLTYGEKARTTVDGSWDNIPIVLISTAELMAGFLAASLPTYRPIYRRLRNGKAQGDTEASNLDYRSRFEHSKNTVNITGGRGSVPLSGFGINVTNQIEMSIHPNHRDEWMRVSDETDDDQHRLTAT